MKHFWSYFMVALLLSCTATKRVTGEEETSLQLQRILDDNCCTNKTTIVGTSMSVKSPKLDIDFTGSAGFDSKEKTRVLKAEQPFRIASLTKVFVASAIMRLQEQQLLSLEDPISKYISDSHTTILRNGGYDPDKITVRHCLNHTSGLYDYAEGGPEYIQEAAKDPNKRWTRTEQIEFAMHYGRPHAQPGTEEHYSDTGYVLLGEIIEQQTQMGLAEGLRKLLKFDELQMSSTYLESLEKTPNGLPPHVRRYAGDLDASTWDNSIDLYGGGGLVSTTRDLTNFLQALFNGKIFEKGDTLDIMLLKKAYSDQGSELPSQRLGFTSIVGKKSGLEVYLHSGFWGTLFMHIPEYNCSIALNHTNDGDSEVLQKTIDFIIKLGKRKAK